MNKIVFALILLGASPVLSQTPAKDTDALPSLLAEVRHLRQDIEAITVASERMQIALVSLQMQDGAVARATGRLDAVTSRCSGAQVNHDHLIADVQRGEAAFASGTVSAAEAADLRSRLSEVKSQTDAAQAEVLACQAAEADASSQLRNDQAKLADLQDRIDRLDKTLEKLGAAEK
jgi:chromosome segregation ATPase